MNTLIHFTLLLSFFLCSLIFSNPKSRENSSFKAIEETDQIFSQLLDDKGQPTSIFHIKPEQESGFDLPFKQTVSSSFENYISWAYEFSDIEKKLTVRMASEGKMPETVHWNGLFSSGEKIEPSKRYFYRILLIYEDERVVSSSWLSFETKVKYRRFGVKAKESYLDLFLVPEFGMGYASIKTNSFNTTSALLKGDFSFAVGGSKVGMNYLTSISSLVQNSTSSTQASLSELSVFCRYYLLGEPVRFYQSGFFVPTETFKSFQIDLGLKLFISVLKGSGNTAIDRELARSYQGISALITAEQYLSSFRFRGVVEAGYSAFRGKQSLLSAEGVVYYEGYHFISPGLNLKYTRIGGRPASDSEDGGNGGNLSVSNQILFAGLSFSFKI